MTRINVLTGLDDPPSLHCNNAETTTSTHLALNEQGPKVTLYHVVHGTS